MTWVKRSDFFNQKCSLGLLFKNVSRNYKDSNNLPSVKT